MIIIDPYKINIQSLLTDGDIDPLTNANNFISPINCRKLICEFLKISENLGDLYNYFYIDILPFDRFSVAENLLEFFEQLSSIIKPRPVIIAKSESFFNIIDKKYRKKYPVVIIKYNADGTFENIFLGSKIDEKNIDNIIRDITQKSDDKSYLTYEQLRKKHAQSKLLDLLDKEKCAEVPFYTTIKNPIRYVVGKHYFEMRNGMLVSCYLNIKKLGSNFSNLTDIAYEIILRLSNYSLNNGNEFLDKFDYFITPNNTSLFLNSTLQMVLNKPIIPLDKLGPIPSLLLHSKRLKEILDSKKCILLVEVMATGSEIDRTIMFLNSLGTNLIKIIAVYNLDIGKPYLIEEKFIHSLCKPKDWLGYVYRSC